MLIPKIVLRAFYNLKRPKVNFEYEYRRFKNFEGWFVKNDEGLCRFLKKRGVKVEARLNKTEIEKIVRRHLPSTLVKKWDGMELIVEVDVFKLKRNRVRGIEIYNLDPVKCRKTDYVLCPVLKDKGQKLYVLLQ